MANFYGKNWMGRVHGDWRLSELNIPGTHESCARYGGVGYECQTLDLLSQLAAGIRFLDIRCRHFNNYFTIHHEAKYQELEFKDVLNACTHFLDDNPTECIIMSIKEEYDWEGCTRPFEETFDSYVSGNERYWYLGDRIPMLSQVRGKIVLLRRFGADHQPKGIDVSRWADDLTFDVEKDGATLKIQDGYYIPFAWKVKDKWDRVERLFSEALSGSKNVWYINFTSGGGGLFPSTVAKGDPSIGATVINDELRDFLEKTGRSITPQSPPRVGSVLMDFPEYPGETLIPAILRLNGPTDNYQYVFPGGDGVIYAIDNDGQLFWYKHECWRDGSGEPAMRRRVGESGWNRFRKVFSSGEGIIYAVDHGGKLIWYRHDGWVDGGGEVSHRRVVGQSGWQEFLNVFSGGDGVIYAIDLKGNLLRYTHTGWRDGSNEASEPTVVGSGGWDHYRGVFGGDGVIYAIGEGNLFWYPKGLGYKREIGTGGWNEFGNVFYGGEGIIYAIDKAGDLIWYKHDSWRDGKEGITEPPRVVGTGGW